MEHMEPVTGSSARTKRQERKVSVAASLAALRLYKDEVVFNAVGMTPLNQLYDGRKMRDILASIRESGSKNVRSGKLSLRLAPAEHFSSQRISSEDEKMDAHLREARAVFLNLKYKDIRAELAHLCDFTENTFPVIFVVVAVIVHDSSASAEPVSRPKERVLALLTALRNTLPKNVLDMTVEMTSMPQRNRRNKILNLLENMHAEVLFLLDFD